MKRAAGEILKTDGDEGVDACSECILFTMNESTLTVIEKYDKHVNRERSGIDGMTGNFNAKPPQLSMNTWTGGIELPPRPSTACKGKKKGVIRGRRGASEDGAQMMIADPNAASPSFVQSDHIKLIVGGQRKELQRNKSFVHMKKKNMDGSSSSGKRNAATESKQQRVVMRPSTAPMRRQWKGQKGRHLELIMCGNWGGQDPAIGLTGLQVLDWQFDPIEVSVNMIQMMGDYRHCDCR